MRHLLLLLLFSIAGTSAVFCSEITPKNWAMASKYSRSHGGEVLRVEQGGKVMYEDYLTGFSEDTPHKIYSGTKCFVAITALIAQQEGLLTLDEKASDTLTEWKGDKRRSITINQLLSQTSGLNPDGDLINPAHDQLAAAVRVHLVDPPGTRFHYGPAGYQAFGEILKRKLQAKGRTVEGYMREKVFDRLGIKVADWKHDDAGNPLMHAGLSLSSKEWAKFGEFIKNDGVYEKKQVVDAKSLSNLFIGHRANPAYGISFWLNEPQPSPRTQKIIDLQPAIDGDQLYPHGPKDLVASIGTGKQRLYIIPSLDLVIVRFGWQTHFSDGDFLSRLLTGHPQPDVHTH